jgi:hypothetical protein
MLVCISRIQHANRQPHAARCRCAALGAADPSRRARDAGKAGVGRVGLVVFRNSSCPATLLQLEAQERDARAMMPAFLG